MFGVAGFFGVLSGLSLIGLTSAADAHIADRYTLYSIAGVILGGGEFVGGRVSPSGAVLGASDAGAGRRIPDLHADLARLADRRAGRHPDRRAGAEGADQPEGGEMIAAVKTLSRKAWIWSYAGAFSVWFATADIYRRTWRLRTFCRRRWPLPPSRSLSALARCSLSPPGPGNVDLSIPANIALSGVVSMKVMDEVQRDDRVWHPRGACIRCLSSASSIMC